MSRIEDRAGENAQLELHQDWKDGVPVLGESPIEAYAFESLFFAAGHSTQRVYHFTQRHQQHPFIAIFNDIVYLEF